MLFHQLISREVVKGKIITEKPLHIGNSQTGKMNPTEVDNPVLKDSKGRAIIPGSSMKGVLRSHIEAILRNPAVKKNWECCDIFDDHQNCDSKIKKIKDQYKNKEKEKEKENAFEIANKIYEESCDVCRLFGNKNMAGRLQIKDMYLDPSVDAIYEYRDGVGINRDTGTAQLKAKFDYEIVPSGQVFDFYLVAENLEERQKRLLELMLTLLQNGEVSIGGKTTRGLGQIRLDIKERVEINADNILEKYGLKEEDK